MSTIEIHKVVVVGAGTMGPGIAATFASHDLEVVLVDIQPEIIEKAKNTVEVVYNTLVNAGLLSNEVADSGRVNLTFSTDLDEALKGADFLLETIPENLELKQSFLKDVDKKVSPDVILASNTSGIPISKLCEVCEHPSRVIGMHWSNPPHIIPVIEVIQGDATSQETVAVTHAICKRVEMIPVDVLRDVPGFVENRILYAIMREALHLVEQGVATPEAVDTITRWGIGYKLSVVGPLELLDVAGLDIYHSVASYLNADLCNESGVSGAIGERVAAGKLGLKTGGGFYEYTPSEIPALMKERVGRWLRTKKILAREGE